MNYNICSSNGTAAPVVETSLPTADSQSSVGDNPSPIAKDRPPEAGDGAQPNGNQPPATEEADLSLPYCEECQTEYTEAGGFKSCCGRKIDLETWLFYEKRLGPPPESLRSGTRRRPVDPMLSREKTSHFRGVSRSRNLWRVLICRNGRQYSVGRYENERTAAQVFDNACYYLTKAGHLKPYLRLNFPDDYQTDNRPAPFFLTKQLTSRFDLENAIFRSSEPSKSQPTVS